MFRNNNLPFLLLESLTEKLTNSIEKNSARCRLDLWLWAARFYKTRSLAASNIKKGLVKLSGKSVTKPSILEGFGTCRGTFWKASGPRFDMPFAAFRASLHSAFIFSCLTCGPRSRCTILRKRSLLITALGKNTPRQQAHKETKSSEPHSTKCCS